MANLHNQYLLDGSMLVNVLWIFFTFKDNYILFAKALHNSYAFKNAKNEPSSELLFFMKEKVLISMSLFLLAFYNSNWNLYFIILKQVNDIASSSGCIARHVAIQHYILQKELCELEMKHKIQCQLLLFLN